MNDAPATLRYGLRDVGDNIAFFNSAYDPLYNIGIPINGNVEDYPRLMRCSGGVNNCTMLPF